MAQNPGFHSLLNLPDFGPIEREIANNLATVWFVSYANIYYSAKTRLPYLYLKPTDALQDAFGFRQELLCIFHGYELADKRLINTIDTIIEKEGSRLDRLCALLITNASDISNDLRHSDPEKGLRIVIPFTFRELHASAAGAATIIDTKLRKNLYAIDLFAISSVLKTDSTFFGRREEIQMLVRQYEF